MSRSEGSAPVPRAITSGRYVAIDALLASCYLAVLLVDTLGTAHSRAWGDLLLSCLGVVLIAAPVALRRRWPLSSLAAVIAGSALAGIEGSLVDSVPALALCTYTVGATNATPRRLPALAGGLLSAGSLFVLVVGGSRTAPQTWSAALLAVASTSGAWSLGRFVREQRASAARAVELATADALTHERLHIARELHDVVAHGISLIAVKAQVANHVAGTHPEEARDALRVIEETSKSSLAELRRVLDVLRTPVTGPGKGSTLEVAPVPGLAELEPLVASVAAAGVAAELELHVEEQLPAGVELLAYRVVQEALTNVVKHAAPTRCTVLVEAGDGAMLVRIADEGSAGHHGRDQAPTLRDRHGYGLLGTRERVTLYGGSFKAWPGPDGGFVVQARVPYSSPGIWRPTTPVE